MLRCRDRIVPADVSIGRRARAIMSAATVQYDMWTFHAASMSFCAPIGC
jgi:hypothetical protein